MHIGDDTERLPVTGGASGFQRNADGTWTAYSRGAYRGRQRADPTIEQVRALVQDGIYVPPEHDYEEGFTGPLPPSDLTEADGPTTGAPPRRRRTTTRRRGNLYEPLPTQTPLRESSGGGLLAGLVLVGGAWWLLRRKRTR